MRAVPVRAPAFPLLAAALAAILAPSSAAGGGNAVQTLVLEGDGVGGVGGITRIDNIAIDENGNWYVEADTDNIDTDADSVLLDSGGLVLREGDALAAPAGATLGSFDTVNRNTSGNSGWNFFLDGTTGSSDDSGVYFNTNLLIQEGDLSTSPAFSAGTPYIGFFECKINASNQIVVIASIDDVNIPSSTDRAIVLLEVDGGGNLMSETVLYKEGDVLPGEIDGVADWDTGPHNFAFNDAGQLLHAFDLDGDSTVDDRIYLDDTLIAAEEGPSPVAARTWASLASPELDINNDGDVIYSGSLNGDTASNLLIVVNDEKFKQEGDTFYDDMGGTLTTASFTSFGSGPLHIADNGCVAWYGDWDGATDFDTALFVDQFPIVREGVTQIGLATVDTLRGVQEGYVLSRDGRYLMFEAILDNGNEGAFLIDLEPWLDLGYALAGTTTPCFVGSGVPSPGNTVTLTLSDALPSTTSSLVVGFSVLNAPFKGGLLVPAVDLLIPGLPVNGVGQLQLQTVWPSGVPAGIKLYLQHWVVDGGGPKGLAASNALRLVSQ